MAETTVIPKYKCADCGEYMDRIALEQPTKDGDIKLVCNNCNQYEKGFEDGYSVAKRLYKDKSSTTCL